MRCTHGRGTVTRHSALSWSSTVTSSSTPTAAVPTMPIAVACAAEPAKYWNHQAACVADAGDEIAEKQLQQLLARSRRGSERPTGRQAR